MSPRVSFGVPVYNGEDTIRRSLDSLLAQDNDDFEVVVCDNASTDGTREILAEYAARDARVSVHLNKENVGQIENCNRVFQLSSGEYFRWLGTGDWLHPQYVSECLAAFDKDPAAIAMTTSYEIHFEEGGSLREEFEGKRVEAEVPHKRFARMLWFYHVGQANYDPLYSLIRRDALEKTPMLRMMLRADWILAAELSLIGRFGHVPKCLSFRKKPARFTQEQESARRAYHPVLYKELSGSPWKLFGTLISSIREARLGAWTSFRCRLSALRFFTKESWIRARLAVRYFRRYKLGLTRAKLLGWRRRKAGNQDVDEERR